MKLSIVIPCYNEINNIDNLIRRITPLQNSYDLEYILVENGSKDDSKVFFQTNVEGKYTAIKVVYVDVNRGYGYGLQQGMKVAEGDYIGWIHADLQISPEELVHFFNEVEGHNLKEKLFLKGRRTNRSLFDLFFTNAQTVFSTCLFGRKIYDVGAVPVLFNKELLVESSIDDMPNDFSIELYIYKEALRMGYQIIRLKVKFLACEKGDSSWNRGLRSRIKQSKKIFSDSLKIKRGEKVL